MHPRRTRLSLRPILCICLLVTATSILALPEDAKQPIDVAASSGEMSLGDGLSVLKGTLELPARITQGSLQITGTEIRIVKQHDELQSATATGNPARFQQQLTPGQEPVKANAREIKFDNKSRVLILDTMVELNQVGKVLVGNHVEYNLDSGGVSASSKDGQQVHMTIPPSKGKQ